MSKVGKKPISLLEGVLINKIDEKKFEVKGPKGSLVFSLPEGFRLEIEDLTKEGGGKILKISPENFQEKIDRKTKALWGTLSRILQNKIIGVKEGFEKVLILEGLGYSAELQGNKIVFKIGFSHPVSIDIPEDIKVEIKQEKGRSLIYIRGIDKEKVGLFATQIKKIKPADRYHQKGLRYLSEVIKLKPVKKIVK